MGIGGTEPQREKIQEEIFYILEQLQHCHGPLLHDRTDHKDCGLHHQWQQQRDIQPKLCRENTVGNSFYLRHHQDYQNRHCVQVLRANNFEVRMIILLRAIIVLFALINTILSINAMMKDVMMFLITFFVIMLAFSCGVSYMFNYLQDQERKSSAEGSSTHGVFTYFFWVLLQVTIM